jgi:amino acid adenylation domain-containing protein
VTAQQATVRQTNSVSPAPAIGAKSTPQAVHHLVEAQVNKTPQAIAIEFADQSITYTDLNQRANQLAHHLQSLGVQPDSLIGICMERSIDLIVAILAILKAGAAYLPLDMAYPSDRLSYMLDNAEAPILLSQQSLIDQLPATKAQIIFLDQFEWQATPENSSNPTRAVSPENLAYVIYTSGSTGKPKGVAMPHLPLWNLLEWQQQQLLGSARTLQFTPISFDVSFQEIFGTLTTGGTLVLITEAMRQDPEALLNQLCNAQIERLFLPFVALRQLAEVGTLSAQTKPTQLRDVITAGEQLRITSAIADWFSTIKAKLHNHYGPSETHVITALTLDGNPHSWDALPTIGQAIQDCETYILDEQYQPVAAGDVGELYLGGIGLARGYLHRPDLTAERFLANPWDATGDRIYKTGDLARYQADGNIEYLGRADQQLKIRGYRIEPGEIETLLETHPDVREAVVVGREGNSGDLRLVGYVIAEADSQPSGKTLRQFVQSIMPDYMVPSTIVRLEQFPTTPSGKVDRRALPAPDTIERSHNQTYIAPSNPIETQLVELWENLLEVKPIGITDNFFDLGGHSLLMTRLLMDIDRVLNQRLPVTILFQAPTIQQLATLIAQGKGEAQSPYVAFLEEGSQAPLFCLHGAQGNLMFGHGLAMYLNNDRPVYGIQEPPEWRGWGLPSQLETIADRYVKTIRSVQAEGPYFLMGYSFGGLVAFEIAQQLVAQGQTIGQLLLVDPDLPVSYSRIFQRLPQLASVRGVPFLLRDLEVHLLRLKQRDQRAKLEYIRQDLQKTGRKLFNPQKLRQKLSSLQPNSATAVPTEGPPQGNSTVQPPTNTNQPQNEFRIFRQMNYHRAIVNYIPQPYPHPITLILTSETRSDLGLWGSWRKMGQCNIHEIPGTHKSILREPDIQNLAEQIRNMLPAAIPNPMLTTYSHDGAGIISSPSD